MCDHLPKTTTYPKHQSFQIKSEAPNNGFLPQPKYIILSKTVIFPHFERMLKPLANYKNPNSICLA